METKLTLQQWRAGIDIFGHKDEIQAFLNELPELFYESLIYDDDEEPGNYTLCKDVTYAHKVSFYGEVNWKLQDDEEWNERCLRFDSHNFSVSIDNFHTGIVVEVDITQEVWNLYDATKDKYVKDGPHGGDDPLDYPHGPLMYNA